MNNLNREVKKYLDILDQEETVFTSYHGEYDIAEKIKNIILEDDEYNPTKVDGFETAAFCFTENYSPGPPFGWEAETYYGPMSALPNGPGQSMQYPSIEKLDREILQYWECRAKQSTNPILSSRYADLVVDFSPEVLKKDADIYLFQIVIDANIAIFEKSLVSIVYCETKINRALDLAIQINDENRVKQAKDAKVQLEKNIEESMKKDYPS